MFLSPEDIHAPSTKDKVWTLCGVYSAPGPDHPVYKQQKFATKAHLVTCPFCQKRIEEYRETGVPPRMRPL